MRKIKLAFWLILLGFLGVIFWQNQAFFLERRGVEIDYVMGNYSFPELQIALYFLIFFLVGLLLSYFSSLSEKFVARKTIRKLNDELTHVKKKYSGMEASLVSRQPVDSNAARTVTSGAANVPELSAT